MKVLEAFPQFSSPQFCTWYSIVGDCFVWQAGQSWEIARGGGGAKRIVRFLFWGGEGTVECPPQNQFWRLQKVEFVWSVPVSSFKENDTA